jgi:hypothetical protein
MSGIEVMRRSAAIPGLATAKRVFFPRHHHVGGILKRSLDPTNRHSLRHFQLSCALSDSS